MITTEGASENETSRSVGDTERQSRNRTIPGAIKALFRAAIETVTGRAEDAPQPQTRRKSGDTDKAFGMASQATMRGAVTSEPAARGRYAGLQPVKAIAADAYADVGLYLADTLAWLNLWQDNAAHGHWIGDDFNAKQEQFYPQP